MGLWQALSRRKALDGEQSELGKVLSTVDLIALGVGSTLGVGVYVLPGIVSRDIAGPGVVLSFLYAAYNALLTGFSYAELGARIPKAGSVYSYSYVTNGELVAYTIGWNLIIKYLTAGASVARGFSEHLAPLLGNIMGANHTIYHPIYVQTVSDYVDVFALIIAVLVSVALAFGVKQSLVLNNVLTAVNCAVVLFVIIIGAIYANFMNWEIPSSEVPVGYGDGGFLPYGWDGTLIGVSTCFYGFVGFDIITTSGEEARNPSRAIPVSIIVSLLIIFLAYFGVSSVLTLMWPYYLQNVGAPLTHVFTELGLDWANWVVTIGGLFGLSASLIGGMFPLPRVLYAMSKDGLLFKFLSRVHPRFKTPFVATILSGILIGTMAFMFSLKDLFDLMSMTSLVGYNLVSISALVLKYRTEAERQLQEFTSDSESSPLLQSSTFKRFTQPFETKGKGPHKSPFASTGFTVFILTVACGLLAFTLASMQNVASVLTLSPSSSFSSSTMSPYFAYILVLIIAFILIMFKRIPDHSTSAKHPKKFQTPGSPFTQTFNIFVNIYLMCHIDLSIWYRLLILLAAGLVIYFIYGLRHSNENQNRTLSQVEYEKLQYIEEIQSGEVSTARVINSQVVDAQHVNLGVTVVRI